MAAKKASQANSKIPKVFTEGEVGVLIEHFDENLKLVVEGQLAFREEVKRDIGKVWDEMGSLREEMRGNFKTVFEYLSRIDDELQEIKKELKGKAGQQDYLVLEKRVARLETELAECKRMAAAKK